MSKDELMKLSDSFQKKADAALESYQETGMSRYGSAYHRNEELADALRMAAAAEDEHMSYISMKVQMSSFVQIANAASNAETEEKRFEIMDILIRDIISYGGTVGIG